MAAAVDDDWEYEYDESETEDFYIPIDLSNVPSAQVPINSERRPGHPTLLKSRLRALNLTRGQPLEITNNAAGTPATATTMGELQIIGLHTTNPLVMYNGQLLSCHWTSTIGTDMFFTKPETEVGDLGEPLRSLPSVDLLSLGTAKLVAKVGRLRPRDDLFDDEGDTQPAPQASGAAEPHTSGAGPAQSASDIQATENGSGTASSTFLARLNEVKARRGEKSQLVVTQTPEGSRLVSAPMEIADPPNDAGISRQLEDVSMSGT
ncbi:hypothetical protein FB567DRAFT_452970 [Paraphoma chrysanthemicola]|uniref:Transcription factor TFIIIC triple barrel domain-containing protein n=1 Tax=Paraphoma chrysanthemicola TaxID=798071 RepID=A0A8K0QXE5_9PLEO|nr:hypothetical protein FB567DRAFT_452970 [Paraphoma chrysanthemicola]